MKSLYLFYPIILQVVFFFTFITTFITKKERLNRLNTESFLNFEDKLNSSKFQVYLNYEQKEKHEGTLDTSNSLGFFYTSNFK